MNTFTLAYGNVTVLFRPNDHGVRVVRRGPGLAEFLQLSTDAARKLYARLLRNGYQVW